jgi:hypothetical protein
MVFGLRNRTDRLWNVDGNRIANADDPIGGNGLPGDRHLAVFDKALNLRAGVATEDAGQVPIEADTCFLRRDEQLVSQHNVLA